MLYVFLVNTGNTLTFDMQLAMQTVSVLKNKIEESSRIPPDKQVLLISGGEWLDGQARVGSYSAGTDTSPIFLFSKQGEPPQLPTTAADAMHISDEIEDQVAGSLTLPPSYSTVVSRSQLAQQIFEQGKEQVRQCDQLIHEQHMQQQGWAAVVANTDDTSQQLENTGATFTGQFEKYLSERAAHFELVAAFEADLRLLARIPMLPELGGALGGSTPVAEGTSLLDWISTHDAGTLEEVCAGAGQGLDQLDAGLLQTVTAELRQILDPAQTAEMTEIRGLEERLMRLDELRHRAQLVVAEQKELAKAFIQNQARASCVNDPSVLPDLCASHCTHLQVMLEKHKLLVDARRRCAKAKEELSGNIHQRLGWVISVQQRMTELTGTLLLNAERLKKLREQVAILSTLHQAPTWYLTAVAEVVRRRQFTARFLEWAGGIASRAAAVHAAETAVRARFAGSFRSHFFRSMFPGVDAVPPPFATARPADYDARLPPLDERHVSRLRQAVPELAHLLAPPAGPPPPLPPAAAAGPQLGAALRRLRHDARQLTAAVEGEVAQFGEALAEAGDRLAAAVAAVDAAERRRIEEQRQQTEALESRLSAEAAGHERQRAAAAEAQEAALRQLTLEQTVELERAEERAAGLERLLEEQRQAAAGLRAQLEAGADRQRVVAILEASFAERERKAVAACADRLREEREAERRAEREAHAAQLQRSAEEQRTRLILEWKEVNEKQKREIEERAERHLAELQADQARQAERQAAQAEAEREAAVQAATDRLRAEHRAEVQALRSRFRMMTSNLGSPSDGSSENLPVGSPPSEAGPGRQRVDSARAALGLHAERDALLDHLRAARRHVQSAARGQPCGELQRAADRLADGETRLMQLEAEPSGPDAPSLRRLQRDNERLRMQLSRGTSGLLERGQVSVLSCNDGDLVLIVWDAERHHYRVYQEASAATYLCFVHADCLPSLGLAGEPRRQYAVAEVISHEFCQARKEGNRYRVPRGTRFYRVRVKPWTRPAAAGGATADLTASTRRLSLRSAESVESHEAAS